MTISKRGGVKSLAELTQRHAVIERPDAPYNLTDAEADEWRAIVASMAPDYFARSHYPLLSQLCRHIVNGNRIAQLIEKTCRAKKLDQQQFADLLGKQALETNSIVRICRQLRLGHQQSYRADCGRQRPQRLLDTPWKVSEEQYGEEANEE